jgi:hypothetical protein
MKFITQTIFLLSFFALIPYVTQSEAAPDKIKFVRQAARRLIFDAEQSIPLATLDPTSIVGLPVMHPARQYADTPADISISEGKLVIQSQEKTTTGIWFGGFNPFATYSIDVASTSGTGELGFEFSDALTKEHFFITLLFQDKFFTDARLRVIKDNSIVTDESIAVNIEKAEPVQNKIVLQMLGSGLVLYVGDRGFVKVCGQSDFNAYMDLRKKQYIRSFQSHLFLRLDGGHIKINKVDMALTAGVGLADIRAITYENGDPLLDQGRLWYSMSIRGRALPHHIQGVFSLNPTVFDLKLEGIILFDRNDGLLRNEIASHIFYDRKEKLWRGLTTGFSAYANPEEKKQLLAVESKIDPRFGFSVMNAQPFGMVGDIEDPHILYDEDAEKWRMLTCENQDGYKAILLESDFWNKDFRKIAGPVPHNSTGTSIQKIGEQFYCFSGSSERNIFIYTYPALEEAGTLNMDLPPWNETSGTRVWPNVVQLPPGYPVPYVALMMDRFNYPGMHGPHWSYGALYLYHGYNE